MSKIGFIGYGHMGSVLLNSLLSSGAILPKDVVISTRTKGRLAQLCSEYPDIQVADSSAAVAVLCKRIFIMTGTFDVVDVMREIRAHINEATHLILISGGLEIKSIEAVFGGRVTRLMPTMISEVREGYTLVCHNGKTGEADKAFIEGLLSNIGRVKTASEEQFEVGSCLTSCAPALFASMLKELCDSAARHSGLSYGDAYELALYTVLGTAKLLIKTEEDCAQLVTRVATKGGSTERGVRVLEQRLPAVFDEMLENTLVPHTTRKEKTRQQFAALKTGTEGGDNRD